MKLTGPESVAMIVISVSWSAGAAEQVLPCSPASVAPSGPPGLLSSLSARAAVGCSCRRRLR